MSKKISRTTDSSSLIATKVAAFRETGKQSPSPVSNIFKAEQDSLDRSGVPRTIISTGTLFPDAPLIDPAGKPTTLKQTVNGQPAVIIFYRGAWCPYCNIALSTYQQVLLPKLKQLGVMLVAISPQKPDGSMTMKQKHNLDFSVLSDSGNQIAEKLGILTAPTPEAQAAQKKMGLDLADVNADHTAALPMPTAALIDKEGMLVWIDVHPNYTTRTEPDEILLAVDSLLKENKQ